VPPDPARVDHLRADIQSRSIHDELRETKFAMRASLPASPVSVHRRRALEPRLSASAMGVATNMRPDDHEDVK